nr:hypothetical protein [Tanacetum cinerariifolium]
MVAILEKSEHNIDFYPMVDFIEASPLSPSFSGRIVPFFDTMLVQQGEGSGIPTEPYHTPSPEAQSPSHTTHTSPSLPPVTTTSISTVIPTKTTPIMQYTRRDRIAQSSVLPTVADEPASPLPDEVEINRLKERVKMLEDREGVAATRFRDDAPIKGRSMDERKAATERNSDDSEEMATVLTSMDAATVLASGVVDVPTSSGSIPTASTPAEEKVPTGSDVVPIASPIFVTATMVTPYRRRKGKEVMVESKTLKKPKVQEQIDAQVTRELEEQLEREDQRRSTQIARDAEIARIHAEEDLQIIIDSLDKNNETLAKYLQECHQNNLGWKVKDFRGMTFKEVEAKFNSVWKQMEDFIPMGSKEDAERIKRKGLNLEHESAKKQKTSEEFPEEAMSPEEVPEEKRSYWKITRLGGSSASYQFFIDLLKHLDREDLNQLWRLVKETLSHRPPTIEWKLYDSCRVHHVTAKYKEIFMLVEKDYPLRKGLALMMISYKLQVENYSQMANDLILKIYKIANSPRQQGIPTASYKSSHWQNNFPLPVKKVATARRKVKPQLGSLHCYQKTRRNCQSKSNDSFTILVPHVTPDCQINANSTFYPLEIDELESDKADFSNIYDLLLQECVSKEEEHPRCFQANGSKVKEKLVHLMMVMKFEVLIEKKKKCSLCLMRQYTRRARIAQSSALPPVADKPASPMRDVNQDRATIAKSYTLPHDTAPRVTSPAAIEGSIQQTINELTALCTSLQRQHSELLFQFQAQKVEINKLTTRVKILEDDEGVIGARSVDDAPINGRRIDEKEGITGRVSSYTKEIRMDEWEVAVEKTIENTKEIATVLTFMDATTVLAGGIDVPTGSYSIPTAGFPVVPVVDIHTGSDAVPTASLIVATATVVTPYSEEREKKLWWSLTLQRNRESTEKTMDQKAEEGLLYDCDQKQLRTFPMGSKEEVERLKRKEFNLKQKKAKKQKTSEEVPDKEKS